MPGLNIILDGDGCWPDLISKQAAHGELEGVALLAAGMQSGAPSVGFRIKLDDGRIVLAETSFALLEAATRAFRGRVDAMTGVESWTPSTIGTPTSKEEYDKRYQENAHASGFGFDRVRQHFPCPFCAAPEWLVVRLLDLERSSPKTDCRECGRGAQMIYTHVPTRGATIQLVQTRGDDPPEWIPKMRRVEP